MAYADAVATFQTRMQANLPQIAIGGNSFAFNFAQAFLTADADTQKLIGDATVNMFLATATGLPLEALCANYGVRRFTGYPSTVSVVFSVQQPAPANFPIPAGTVLSTVGDGVTPAVAFITQASTTIAAGATSSPAVTATSSVNGIATNAGSGTINIVASSLPWGTASVTNAIAATGGVDPDSDATLRNKAFAVIASRGSLASIQTAILGVTGVFDAYVYDPQDGTGKITYMWCDINGATPGLTGTTPGSLTVSGTVAAGTLAALVDAAVLAILPPAVTVVRSSFTVVDFGTASNHINVAWTGPASLLPATIDPIIQTAVAAYVQALSHNAVPLAYTMSQAVAIATGNVLTNFTLSSSVPTIGAAANTTIYRLTGAPGTYVVVTP